MSNLSFREKSILGSLIGLVLISAYYFIRAFGMLSTEGVSSGEIASLGISLLVALVILEIIYQSVISGFSPEEANEAADERDRLIAARAGRNAGVVLAVCLLAVVVHIMGNALLENDTLTSPLVLSHLILLSLVVYQVVDYGSQLIAYRRGV